MTDVQTRQLWTIHRKRLDRFVADGATAVEIHTLQQRALSNEGGDGGVREFTTALEAEVCQQRKSCHNRRNERLQRYAWAQLQCVKILRRPSQQDSTRLR